LGDAVHLKLHTLGRPQNVWIGAGEDVPDREVTRPVYCVGQMYVREFRLSTGSFNKDLLNLLSKNVPVNFCIRTRNYLSDTEVN
jgi:hypothetical protein